MRQRRTPGGGDRVRDSGARGAALLMTMMVLLLLSVLAAAVGLAATVERAVAANHRRSVEALYAAEAALERALGEMPPVGSVDAVLGGSQRSSFVDGPPGGWRARPDGATLDLSALTNAVNCGHVAACTDAELDAATADRPWGANNPRWQLYAYGPLAALLSPEAAPSLFYIVVWVADDGAETDGDPTRDGGGVAGAAGGTPAGTGVIVVRAEAFGPAGARRAIEAAVALPVPAGEGEPTMPGPQDVRILWWRDGGGARP